MLRAISYHAARRRRRHRGGGGGAADAGGRLRSSMPGGGGEGDRGLRHFGRGVGPSPALPSSNGRSSPPAVSCRRSQCRLPCVSGGADRNANGDGVRSRRYHSLSNPSAPSPSPSLSLSPPWSTNRGGAPWESPPRPRTPRRCAPAPSAALPAATVVLLQRRHKVFVSKHNSTLNLTAQAIVSYVTSQRPHLDPTNGGYDSDFRITPSHVVMRECPFCPKPTHGKADNLYKVRPPRPPFSVFARLGLACGPRARDTLIPSEGRTPKTGAANLGRLLFGRDGFPKPAVSRREGVETDAAGTGRMEPARSERRGIRDCHRAGHREEDPARRARSTRRRTPVERASNGSLVAYGDAAFVGSGPVRRAHRDVNCTSHAAHHRAFCFSRFACEMARQC